MFRTWAFTEMPYPAIPPAESFDSVRVSLPNGHYDPELGAELYQRYFDIYAAADEFGLDIMINEHHATATCVQPGMPLSMAILARDTKQARLLALGNPVANRGTPVRIAEEMAMVDVISQGRSEVGFVRSVPMEMSAGNVNPVDTKARFWEAADLIIKAWTTHDGPFNWEGRYFHHRQVNIWPRPYQQPHPPIWVPTQTVSTALEVAEKQYTVATILNGWEGAKRLFDGYRSRSAECGHPEPPLDRFAYLGLVFVGKTDAEGFDGARQLQWYMQNNKVAPQFNNVPGHIDVKTRAMIARRTAKGETVTGPNARLANMPIEQLTEEGYVFAGSPDTVFDQLARFYDRVGGFGNLLAMVQAGPMTEPPVIRSMQLFAEEVLPRVREQIYRPLPSPSGTGLFAR